MDPGLRRSVIGLSEIDLRAATLLVGDQPANMLCGALRRLTVRPASVATVARPPQVGACSRWRDRRKPMAPVTRTLEMLQQHGQGDQVDQAKQDLPDQADPDQHYDLLQKFGTNPQELLGKLGGEIPGP